ncbi:disease resistance protein At4g27190-like [Vitis riparia]|uniref:disease resistance protein At4g27190-like n=1 Tax=Vitis riparia TaxID=96939 RepID=UPI00155A97BE|nr:disease resistance protein At4g27190-like [Vitis riparia]XP_034702561.1 disease resistance protein At4g27190-like [Vitis riparia]
MALEAAAGAAVETAVTEVYRDGRSLLIWSGRKFGYRKNLKRNHEDLMQKARELWELRNGIREGISQNRIRPDTTEWMANVEMNESEVIELDTKYNDRKNHPWKLFRFGKGASLSKDMAEKYKQVLSLWEEGKRKRGVLDAELPKRVVGIRPAKIEYKSPLHKHVEAAVHFLEDPEIKRIGIWGMVGTGKTTIIENLNTHDNIKKMFDIVIRVTVPKEWSEVGLQQKIMRRLNLNMGGPTDIEENTQIIFEELKKKKCLILLDEVCHPIELKNVIGIHGIQDCKVVLASRDLGICREMDVDETINVKPLSSDEAFNMFKEKVGEFINSIPRVVQVGQLVVRECGGLPLLIDKFAKTFKRMGGNVQHWRDAQGSLRNSMNKEGMDAVLERLEFCYNSLDSDAKKDCFLYCALFSEECDIYIRCLVEYWRVEGFIDNNGHEILSHLINVSLLESCGNKISVKMNKVIREMALKVSLQRKDSKFLAKPCEGLHELPNPEEWQQASRISLMDNELHGLPETPDCRDLLTLLLQRNENLIVIPKLFFTSMCCLRVLDLHGTGIESLPSSLCRLICLGGLYLNSCINLVGLPTDIDALERLEVLDIRGTKLSLCQIRTLTWLKLLRISLSNFGKGSHTQNQSGYVSSFVSLEEFSIDIDSSLQWWAGNGNIITEEVATLKKLTSLQFCFPTVQCLEIFMRNSSAWKDFFNRTSPAREDLSFTFQFAVGYHSLTCFQILESFDDPSYNCLKFIDGKGTDHILKVLAKTHTFGLVKHKGVSRLSDFGIENMNDLFICSIEECNEIETIIDGTGITQSVLKCLRHLHIKNVLKLKSIWQGPVHAGSLTRLRTLTLVKCPRLENIFSNGIIQQLSKLEDLRVEECDEIQEIIMESENNGLESNQLPRLKTLTLLNLKTLTSVWGGDPLEWRSLQVIEISMCPELKRLPFNNYNATKLRSIKGQRAWWEALKWKDDGAIKQRLESLCIFN